MKQWDYENLRVKLDELKEAYEGNRITRDIAVNELQWYTLHCYGSECLLNEIEQFYTEVIC